MKYGIHIHTDQETVLAITQFRDNIIPVEFDEISEDEFNNYTGLFTPFHKWNDVIGDLELDTAAKDAYDDLLESEELYEQLEIIKKHLEIAIDLGVQSQIDDLQAKYDQVKNDYAQLTTQA